MLLPFFEWCETLWLGQAVIGSNWLFPVIELVHLLGLALLAAVRRATPQMHIHAFSPLEIRHGAATLGLSLRDYLLRLREARRGQGRQAKRAGSQDMSDELHGFVSFC